MITTDPNVISSDLTLRDQYTISYAEYLHSDPGLWRITVDYLCTCGDIGKQMADQILMRVPLMSGGAYLIGAMGSVPFFWWWMRTNLGKKGKSVGFAMLNYSASLFSCDSTPRKSLRLFALSAYSG